MVRGQRGEGVMMYSVRDRKRAAQLAFETFRERGRSKCSTPYGKVSTIIVSRHQQKRRYSKRRNDGHKTVACTPKIKTNKMRDIRRRSPLALTHPCYRCHKARSPLFASVRAAWLPRQLLRSSWPTSSPRTDLPKNKTRFSSYGGWDLLLSLWVRGWAIMIRHHIHMGTCSHRLGEVSPANSEVRRKKAITAVQQVVYRLVWCETAVV